MGGYSSLIANPIPATLPPPGVNDGSNVGTAAAGYAMGDHTHASKARKARILGVTTATYTWTYPTPFGVGVVPICEGSVEDPSASTVDNYSLQVLGIPTNTQVTFKINRTTVALGVLGLNASPGTVNLHLTAFEP